MHRRAASQTKSAEISSCPLLNEPNYEFCVVGMQWYAGFNLGRKGCFSNEIRRAGRGEGRGRIWAVEPAYTLSEDWSCQPSRVELTIRLDPVLELHYFLSEL